MVEGGWSLGVALTLSGRCCRRIRQVRPEQGVAQTPPLGVRLFLSNSRGFPAGNSARLTTGPQASAVPSARASILMITLSVYLACTRHRGATAWNWDLLKCRRTTKRSTDLLFWETPCAT